MLGAASKKDIFCLNGRIKLKNATGSPYQYEYALRDHLGNTRVMVCDSDKDGSPFKTNTYVPMDDISQINHYYPFGMNMEGPWNGSNTSIDLNKYQYNGKELNDDFGLNWNDYGARWYDASIGRFTTIDPALEMAPYHSPYDYAENTPTSFIDFNGMFRLDPYYIKKYPNFAKFVQYGLPLLKDNPDVIKAWIATTGKSEADFAEMVTYGSGPWITPSRPLSECKCNPSMDQYLLKVYSDETRPFIGNGAYDKNYWPDNLLLNRRVVENLENTIKKGDKSAINAEFFIVGISILHEAAHWGTGGAGDAFDDEKGAVFEKNLLGDRLSYKTQRNKGFNRNEAIDVFRQMQHTPRLFGIGGQMPASGNIFSEWLMRLPAATPSQNTNAKKDPTIRP